MNCAQCRFWADMGGVEGQCRHDPPTPFAVPAQGLDGQPRLMIVAGHPPAGAGHWCGKFWPKPQALS